MGNIKPDYHVKRVQDIDLSLLERKNIKLIIFDIDNTLAVHNKKEPAKGVLDWVKKAKERGFLCCLVSNNSKNRVNDFNRHFNFYTIYRAMKPLRWAFLKAAKDNGVPPTQTCVVGDQLFSDILGANKANMMTILVDKLSDVDEGYFIRFKRRLEKRFL